MFLSTMISDDQLIQARTNEFDLYKQAALAAFNRDRALGKEATSVNIRAFDSVDLHLIERLIVELRSENLIVSSVGENGVPFRTLLIHS